MITVWTTKSRLNQTVCAAAFEGIQKAGIECEIKDVLKYDGSPVPSLSYGVLRGTARIYHDCQKARVDWWNIDKGFFGAKHTDGYYRLGYCHLQPLFDSYLVPFLDDSRWKRFEIEIKPWKDAVAKGSVLLCPPEGICEFYGIDQANWIRTTIHSLPLHLQSLIEIRFRDSSERLSTALQRTSLVVTHSSNVALEALVEGIPAVGETGFVHSWNCLSPFDADHSQKVFNRSHLLHQAAWKQWTLSEFANGDPW